MAQGQATAPPPPGLVESLVSMLPMFLTIFLIFFLLVIRPQQQKLKEHQDLISNLKRGDQVVTSSGVFGRVAAIEEGALVLEIASNVRVKFETSHVTKKIEKDPGSKGKAESKNQKGKGK